MRITDIIQGLLVAVLLLGCSSPARLQADASTSEVVVTPVASATTIVTPAISQTQTLQPADRSTAATGLNGGGAMEDDSILPPTTATPPPEDVETDPNQDNSTMKETNRMNIEIGDTVLTATLVENASVDALKAVLSEGPLTIDMRDYGSMEKVGPLGMDLPRNDEQITTEAGDIILYQGNALVIYYASNSWDFTRLGKINNLSPAELKDILGEGNVTITLSLP